MVVTLVVISCSATATQERSTKPQNVQNPESADNFASTHSNQAVMQPPPSFEGTHSWVSLGVVWYRLMEECDGHS